MYRDCTECRGTGNKNETCWMCSGWGYVDRDGEKVNCPNCNGKGIKEQYCTNCSGGKIWVDD